jgi:hypothetical protein
VLLDCGEVGLWIFSRVRAHDGRDLKSCELRCFGGRATEAVDSVIAREDQGTGDGAAQVACCADDQNARHVVSLVIAVKM